MKPRFSILTLLGVTAYVAVNVAAYAQPLGYLPYFSLICDAILFLAFIVVAAGPTRMASVFARAVLLGIGFFYLLQVSEPMLSYEYEQQRFFLTYQRIQFNDIPRPDEETLWGDFPRSLIVDKSYRLAAGVVCGCLGLWHYRALERSTDGVGRSL